MPSRAVKEHYDIKGEEEWERLEKDAYHRLEWLTTVRFLERYLPGSGTVLDAGGGPGRYAIFLAKRGLRVVLLDLSGVQLGIARRKVAEAGVAPGAVDYVEGALPDLSRFPEQHFDAVLCLGPLSHLVEEADRAAAVEELVRVTKKGGPLFVSVIGRYAVHRTVLQDPAKHSELLAADHRDTFEKGIHRDHPPRPTHRLVEGYYFLPDELRKSFEGCGVETLAVASCEGLADHLQEPLARLAQNEQLWARWLELHWQTCTDPSILGAGEHILFVGRKR
jgi:S-adenosylmethionine-dependent methyltransferase